MPQALQCLSHRPLLKHTDPLAGITVAFDSHRPAKKYLMGYGLNMAVTK